MNALDELKERALAAIDVSVSLAALRDIEVKFLGRSGELTLVLRDLKNLSLEGRRVQGVEANALRGVLEDAVAARRAELTQEEYKTQLGAERMDITRPGIRMPKGGLHPLTHIQREIESIFSFMGFAVVDGPEMETEFYNFDALNIPADHPARDMWDTFWLRGRKHLLRTHTSPVQVRYMQKHNPPFRIIVPGNTFRYEATDASHEMQFCQLEGLMVGRDVSLAHLKHVITVFLQKLFKRRVTVRFRPSYFPFVEPGVEVDMSCGVCAGKGCSVCKHTGWLEVMGAGMVHPHVFKAAGLHPRDQQGFAFGFGIDRLAMMKYKIPDVRLFRSGDMRFLKQF